MKTYFVDTNYLLRWLVKEDENQFKVVERLFNNAANGKTSLVSSALVFFEMKWVLSSVYKLNKTELITYLEGTLNLPIEFENKELLADALILFGDRNIDLEDCYNILSSLLYGQKQKIPDIQFASFDKKLMKVFGEF